MDRAPKLEMVLCRPANAEMAEALPIDRPLRLNETVRVLAFLLNHLGELMRIFNHDDVTKGEKPDPKMTH
eukprot:scaffold81899_cov37-Tisochrysis_lutea.AAC.5